MAVIPVVLGGLIVLAAGAWLLARRRRAAAPDRPAESAAPVPPDPAAPLVVGAREGPLDAMAAAAVLALDRGRPDLARIAIRARRPVPPDEPDAQRQLAGRILEAAGRPTDGSGTDR